MYLEYKYLYTMYIGIYVYLVYVICIYFKIF